MKKRLSFYLSVCILGLCTMVACDDDKNEVKEVKIILSETSFSTFAQGSIQVPFTVKPEDVSITTANLSVRITELDLSSISPLRENLNTNANPLQLTKVEKGSTTGEWIGTITINTKGATGTIGLVYNVNDNNWIGQSEQFNVDVNSSIYTGIDRTAINLTDPADWEKDVVIDLSPAFDYFGDGFVLSGSAIQLYNPLDEVWGENGDHPAICSTPTIKDKMFSVKMALDENDQDLRRGVWYWIVKGKVGETDVAIKVPLAINNK